MATQSINKSSVSLVTPKAWLLAATFTVGNILFPQLCHLVPQGGLIFLPIYFFTLIAAVLYGWQVAAVVALMSPIVNFMLFNMPPAPMLPIIMTKGIILAASIGISKKLFNGLCVSSIIFAVLAYQVLGCGIESLVNMNLTTGFQDFSIGMPGIIIQIIAGSVLVIYMHRR